MLILGICDTQHDSSACLIKNNEVIAAISEERLTRVKNQGGFPHLAIAEVCNIANISFDEINIISVAGCMTPPFFVRYFSNLQKIENNVRYSNNNIQLKKWLSDFAQFTLGISRIKSTGFLAAVLHPIIKYTIKKNLPLELKNKQIYIYDHHLCHIASGHYTSGYDKSISISADYWGDGRSLTIYECYNNNHKLLFEVNASESIGFFYSVITKYLGFLPNRHEFKLLGLSARGNHHNVKIEYPLAFDGTIIHYKIPLSLDLPFVFQEKLAIHSKEDVSAWLQYHTEQIILKIINKFVPENTKTNVTLSGGVFGNVKLNKLIYELPQVSQTWIFPNMGDGGLSIGAACLILNEKKYQSINFKNATLGCNYTNDEIELSLNKSQLEYEIANIDYIAKEIVSGKVICLFQGATEFGPRALGNRSIIFKANDKKLVFNVNEKLFRNDFMPFAPLVIEEDYNKYFIDKNYDVNVEFMTTLKECTILLKDECPAVVHVDNTARPQLVKKENVILHKLLIAYKKNSGSSVLINTSFNLHEEPIVNTVDDAIKTFKKSNFDYLYIGNYLIKSDGFKKTV